MYVVIFLFFLYLFVSLLRCYLSVLIVCLPTVRKREKAEREAEQQEQDRKLLSQLQRVWEQSEATPYLQQPVDAAAVAVLASALYVPTVQVRRALLRVLPAAAVDSAAETAAETDIAAAAVTAVAGDGVEESVENGMVALLFVCWCCELICARLSLFCVSVCRRR